MKNRNNRRFLWIPLLAPLAMGCLTAQAADVKDRAIKLSYVTAKDSPYGLGVNRLSELLSQKSGGKMKL